MPGMATGSERGRGSTQTSIDSNPGTVMRAPPLDRRNDCAHQQMTPNTSISREPIAIDDCGAMNPAGLSAADAAEAQGRQRRAGHAASFYPYEGTVFPRGMLAPDLMWDGAAADAVYIHIKSKIFEYWGCLKPIDPGRSRSRKMSGTRPGSAASAKTMGISSSCRCEAAARWSGPRSHTFRSRRPRSKARSITTLIARTACGHPGRGAMRARRSSGFSGRWLGGSVAAQPTASCCAFPRAGTPRCSVRRTARAVTRCRRTVRCLLAQSVSNGAMAYQLMSNGPAPMPTHGRLERMFGRLVSGRLAVPGDVRGRRRGARGHLRRR